jgi:cadmium resistance protein CadD (predicted permease)
MDENPYKSPAIQPAPRPRHGKMVIFAGTLVLAGLAILFAKVFVQMDWLLGLGVLLLVVGARFATVAERRKKVMAESEVTDA